MSEPAYSAYQHLIWQLSTPRLQYTTLTHLSRQTFRDEIKPAGEMSDTELRSLADSYGLEVHYEWWEGRKQPDGTYLGDTELLPVS